MTRSKNPARSVRWAKDHPEVWTSPQKRPHWMTEALWSSLPAEVPVQRCELRDFVPRDYSRVFVGGVEWGFDWLDREADDAEIEAPVERFGWHELRQILAKRRDPWPLLAK